MTKGLSVVDALKTHPEFTITCDACGSQVVYVENTQGFSPESGSWGGVDLVCDRCGARTEIVST